MKAGPRGKRQAIVGEALVRVPGSPTSDLYEQLACGHYQVGQYGRDGMPCSSGGMPASSRICRQCRDGAPIGPHGEIVDP